MLDEGSKPEGTSDCDTPRLSLDKSTSKGYSELSINDHFIYINMIYIYINIYIYTYIYISRSTLLNSYYIYIAIYTYISLYVCMLGEGEWLA